MFLDSLLYTNNYMLDIKMMCSVPWINIIVKNEVELYWTPIRILFNQMARKRAIKVD